MMQMATLSQRIAGFFVKVFHKCLYRATHPAYTIAGHLDSWMMDFSEKLVTWTKSRIFGQQSSARTALWPSRPQCLICSLPEVV